MTRVYVSGPMTGYPDLNVSAFREAARRLRTVGASVVNPHELDHFGSTEWHEFMRTDIAALVGCDGVATLPGWQESRGAVLEVHIAHALGMAVEPIERWVE
ncbi:DUF4406 domain-containing protein [Rarobacter faecitabidus]|uniref:DUF4406 domain-containing protein n=1 Tax=Rarobacter faecitabidus TaxID=13243 RepID=UPI00115293DC|nr:DUF4406 domain-containing protein [Rarobacter faecitabidus]